MQLYNIFSSNIIGLLVWKAYKPKFFWRGFFWTQSSWRTIWCATGLVDTGVLTTCSSKSNSFWYRTSQMFTFITKLAAMNIIIEFQGNQFIFTFNTQFHLIYSSNHAVQVHFFQLFTRTFITFEPIIIPSLQTLKI